MSETITIEATITINTEPLKAKISKGAKLLLMALGACKQADSNSLSPSWERVKETRYTQLGPVLPLACIAICYILVLLAVWDSLKRKTFARVARMIS